jgi:hypothetical protein
VWGVISNYLLLQELHLPTTLLLLFGLLPCWAAVIAACCRYHCGEKKVSQQHYIFLRHFALAMTIVILVANVIAAMMAMAPAMICHCLFYDSYKTIVAIRVLPLVLRTNWCTTICIIRPILCKIECNEFVCKKFLLVLV